MADTITLPQIDILIDAGEWGSDQELRDLCRKAVMATVRTAPLKMRQNSELSVLLTDDTSIRKLNRDWRGNDKSTNVLSFPAAETVPESAAGPLLGDIALAYETIAREARLEEKRFDHHLSHLVIHGFLHLFGYDHDLDHKALVMEELERLALAELGIQNPYA